MLAAESHWVGPCVGTRRCLCYLLSRSLRPVSLCRASLARELPVRRVVPFVGFPACAAGNPIPTPTPSGLTLSYGINRAKIRGMTTTVEELIQAATDARRIAQKAIELAVREARAADWSWDQISAALGGKPNGETLRRNFSSE